MPTTEQRISVISPEPESAELSALAEKYDIAMVRIDRRAILDYRDRNRKNLLQLSLTFSASAASRLDWPTEITQ